MLEWPGSSSMCNPVAAHRCSDALSRNAQAGRPREATRVWGMTALHERRLPHEVHQGFDALRTMWLCVPASNIDPEDNRSLGRELPPGLRYGVRQMALRMPVPEGPGERNVLRCGPGYPLRRAAQESAPATEAMLLFRTHCVPTSRIAGRCTE